MRSYLWFVVISIFLALGCGGNREVSWSFPTGEGLEARGQELFYGVASCNSCHGDQSWFSKFNDWTVAQLRFAIRNGESRDGDSFDAHAGYEWLSERDTYALVAYIGTLSGGLLQSDALYEESESSEEIGFVPAINPRYKLAYGRYLVDHVARCGSCHTMGEGLFTDEKYLGGGEEIEKDGGSYEAPALVGESKFNTWAEHQMKAFFQYGVKADGSNVNPTVCPVGSFGRAKSEDIDAMITYLQSVQPE